MYGEKGETRKGGAGRGEGEEMCHRGHGGSVGGRVIVSGQNSEGEEEEKEKAEEE